MKLSLLFALLLVGCGASGIDETGSALIGPTPNDGGFCVAGQSVCRADHHALYECLSDSGGDHWGAAEPCPDYCLSSTDSYGFSHDRCVQCEPGARYCDGTMHICNSQGRWLSGGLCTPQCGCGGTYPHCHLCE
jgi:hypothetical protein